MSHFAQLDANDVVLRVLVIEQDQVDTGKWGDPASFVQTSYNTRGGVHYDPATGKPSADQRKALHKNYAGIGYRFDRARRAFISPQPFASWVLDEKTCLWNAPVHHPKDGKMYAWDEATRSWKQSVGISV